MGSFSVIIIIVIIIIIEFCLKQNSRAADHFMVFEQLFNTSVKSASVIYDVDNTSDHDPLLLEWNPNSCLLYKHKYKPKPSWNKATSEHIDEYKRLLCSDLDDIVPLLPTEALLCRDLSCHDQSHINLLSTFVTDIFCCLYVCRCCQSASYW